MVIKKKNEYHQAHVSRQEKKKSFIHNISIFSLSLEQTHVPNTFHPLRDMGLEVTNKKDHDVDEFGFIEQHHDNRFLTTLPKQQHIENWLDDSNGNHQEYNEPITAMTINRLEEQIQTLKIKVEDINARLENITSIIQETHPGNVIRLL